MPRKRKTNTRKANKRIFILCEGEKTEINYFNGLKQDCRFPGKLVEVRVINYKKKKDAYSLIKAANGHKELKKDEAWVVVDKDGYTKHAEAFELAQKLGVGIAFSSISFEFWLLLHFGYTTRSFSKSEAVISHMDRERYFSNGYRKNDGQIYEYLRDKTDHAIKNAERLRTHHREIDPDKLKYKPFTLNPYTDVDKLGLFGILRGSKIWLSV